MIGKGFRIICFYGKAETHKRKESWALLKHLSSLSAEPWVCMVDFNEILDNSERRDVGFDWVGRLKISEKQLQITSYMI
jgi:hypothetical protein